ncbi:hypothetical protein ACVWY3_003272 [Bradyrhizobium sp. USDA 4486]
MTPLVRAAQPPRRQLPKTEIGLVVRTGAVAGDDVAVVPDHEQIAPGDANNPLSWVTWASALQGRSRSTCSAVPT